MELLTVQETAALLRVSTVTVRRHIAAGRLKARRFGRRVRVERDDLDEFLEPTAAELQGQPFTEDDALWDIVGLVETDGPGDVSENKYKYLAEAYQARTE